MHAISGEVKISAVEGNTQRLDGGAMFGNAPRPMWERWCPPDELGRIPLHCRSLLIEYAGQHILCETGIGAFFEPKLAERYGVQEKEHRLLSSLRGLGLDHKDIDAVILSHMHFDHAGGLLPAYDESVQNGSYELLFPNALYIVGATAFARSKKPHSRDRASFIPGLAEKMEHSGRLKIVEGDKLPGFFEDRLSFFYTDGHTPGHMHTKFRGDNDTVVFAGDLIPGTAWVHLPITMGYDRFAEKVIDEKAKFYEEAVPARFIVFYTHDSANVASRIAKDANGKFVSCDVMQELVQRTI